MLFNSFAYALFLPAVFLLYWIPLGKYRLAWQNILLLLASYVFYCSWDWRFAFLIAFTSASSYLSAILIEKGKAGSGKLWVAANIIVNLCILGYFKYAGLFANVHVILPVGISFYTLQALGYTIDVYRGKVAASRNILRFFTFVAFFPQLVAGPIERAARLLPQFDRARQFDYRQAVDGIFLILKGLFLKMVLADRLGVFVDGVYKDPSGATGLPAVVAVLFFAFQLYTDFYSYSEIARGSAKILGMELMLNFKRPYLSGSFKEFWKRWHISLSSWFMDYLYIPLGGNRKGAVRRVVNVFIVFLLSGLWHGASWTFVAWGACCALFMVLLDKPLSRTVRIPGFNQAVVFVLWALSLILFRASTFGDARQVFTSLGFGNAGAVFSYGLGRAEFIFACGLIVLLAFQERLCESLGEKLRERFLSFPAWARVLCAAAVVLIIVFLGRYGIGNASKFIYFQF